MNARQRFSACMHFEHVDRPSQREDFLALLPRLQADHPQRLSPNWEQACAYYANRDFAVGLTICGALISPRLVRQFMLPYYRRLIDSINHLGCDLIIVDSDGDVSELVPLFIGVGVNVMLPFEVQAGMDIRIFRKKYGKNLAIIGGVDKRLLGDNLYAIDVEISEKVIPVLKSGGYIPCLDHTVPPNVNLWTFQQYIDLMRKKTGGVYGN